jgi:dTDP-4-amino-4,6-dideoxygalactose transaminase
LPALLSRRIELAERYTSALRGIPGLQAPFIPDYARPNYQSYAVRVGPDYPLSRNDLMQALLDQGISTRRGIMNAHQEQAYARLLFRPLPHSEDARDSLILLPLFSSMTDEECSCVTDQLAELAGRRRSVIEQGNLTPV